MHFVVSFLRDESGATSIEYCVIASMIALVIITAVKGVGTKVVVPYTTVSTALK